MSQPDKTARYIDEVCKQIASKEVHPAIRLELEGHFAEKIADYRDAGHTKEAATAQAIAEMGDPVSIGRQLHETHKPRIEWSIVAMVAVLLGVGLLTMFSLQTAMGNEKLVEQKWIGMLIGSALFLLVLFSDYSKLKKYSRYLYFATFILLLFTLRTGKPINGTPFLEIGSTIVNSIELSVFLFTIALAGIFAQWSWKERFVTLRVLAYFLPPCLLLASSHQTFAAILFVVSLLFLLLVSPVRRATFLTVIGLAGASIGSCFYLFGSRYMLERWSAYLNPYSDPNGSGYLAIQLMDAVRSAGLWGQGFGSQLETVPLPETDFIFAYMIYSFGLMTGAALFAIGLLLVSRWIRAINRVKDTYGSLLLTGIAVLIFLPYFWSMFMTTGLLPPAPISLPLISHGNAHLILNMVLLGMALNVYRRKDIQPLVQS
ncbi:FtsW/RodA/SpoVE family cell cycle protein [Brevibacillus parabrevis]|uniref:FtsW/RodA/SpoVE family cell cycle protein n=1 Tax=Brevibacillus parabrevis TaxID=54914 RepID=UPI001F613264|nr:FtsW/RodA/SpoVE family cell cycle protein [Brevibacillus parabrevis]MDR5002588.1 FtsW/RodA/SpoVE family cell cycle protein [Brevibacillus parabrevis]